MGQGIRIKRLASSCSITFLEKHWLCLMNRFDFPQDRVLIGAHRGASGYAPENTLAAFRKAIELKADFIELDVRMSKDKQLVVIHDEVLERTTNDKGVVGMKNLNDLCSLDAGSWFGESFLHERIPTLEEVFLLVKDAGMPLAIEIKIPGLYRNISRYPDIEERVIQLIERFSYNDKVLVLSYDQQTLKEVKKLNPTLKMGFLCGGNYMDPVSLLTQCEANGIHIWWEYASRSLAALLHEHGYYLAASAALFCDLSRLAECKRVVANGIDLFCTSHPDRLRRFLSKKL